MKKFFKRSGVLLWIIFLGIYYLNFLQIMADYPYVYFALLGIVAFGGGPLFEKLELKNPKLIDIDKIMKWFMAPLFLPVFIYVSLSLIGFFNPFLN